MHKKLIKKCMQKNPSLKISFQKIVTVSNFLEVPKFQKKRFDVSFWKMHFSQKCMQKNPFLYPPCEERNPHMLVKDLMLIESDSV